MYASKQWHRVPHLRLTRRSFVASLPAMFNLCMNQQLFKRTSAIKVATMKIMDDFTDLLGIEAIMCLPQN